MLFSCLQVCFHERSPIRLLRQILNTFYRNSVLNCLSLIRLPLTKHHRLEWLELQTFIFSQLWRLEVHDHGCWQIWIQAGALLLALQMAVLLCPYMAFPLCPRGERDQCFDHLHFYQDTGPIRLGLHSYDLIEP